MGEFLNYLDNNREIEQKAKAMVLIAYIIRYRLFHGKKSPYIAVNHMVAKTADSIIKPIINYFCERIQYS